MNFYVYKRDDPTTWPRPDCLLLLYDDTTWAKYRNVYIEVCRFDEDGFFIPRNSDAWIYDPEECFYVYLEINNKSICVK